MYRQYEDPYKLEDQLKTLQEMLAEEDDEDRIIALTEDIAELKDRINFAWQDDEFYADLLMEQQEQM